MWGGLTTLALAALFWWGYRKWVNWFQQRLLRAREWTKFKTSLPNWVKLFELFTQATFWIAIAVALLNGFFALHHKWHPSAVQIDKTAELLIILPSFIGSLVPAMMLANIVSWFVPAARRANRRALDRSTSETLGSIMKGLAKLGVPLTLICLCVSLLGAFEPWMK